MSDWPILRETYRPKPVRRYLRAEQRRDVIRRRARQFQGREPSPVHSFRQRALGLHCPACGAEAWSVTRDCGFCRTAAPLMDETDVRRVWG